MSMKPETPEEVQLRILANAGRDLLEEQGFSYDEEPSEIELAAAESRDWLRYNVIMTGRVPLIDEQRGID